MSKRVQSPSSINTYKQCPRKYYYQYIQKLETLPNIHLLRGSIIHQALDNFYNIDLPDFKDDFSLYFKESAQKLLVFYWKQSLPELEKLSLSPDQKKFYFEETMLMLMNWVNNFLASLKEKMEEGTSLSQAFEELTPLREQNFLSEQYSIRGIIDAIHQKDDEVSIIDYKTNTKLEITEEQKLQLAIYSLLYQEKYGQRPSKVGVFFLRHKLKLMKVDEELLELAKTEIQLVHQNTESDSIEDYPCKVSPLCKWSSGCCDFYQHCQPQLNHKKGH